MSGGRDNLKNLAHDRAMSAGKRSSFGQSLFGSGALRMRPDMQRESKGFFQKTTTMDAQSRKVNLNVPKCALILPKRLNEQHKENFCNRLAKGETQENFRNQDVWRPGGHSIKTQTQQEADCKLLKNAIKLKRSISSQKLKKKKKMKRLKSACRYGSASQMLDETRFKSGNTSRE